MSLRAWRTKPHRTTRSRREMKKDAWFEIRALHCFQRGRSREMAQCYLSKVLSMPLCGTILCAAASIQVARFAGKHSDMSLQTALVASCEQHLQKPKTGTVRRGPAMGAGASTEAQVTQASPAELRELAAQLPLSEQEKLQKALALVGVVGAGVAGTNDSAGDGSLRVDVLLPSGRCEAVSMPPDSMVSDLEAAARRALGLQGRLRLAGSDGELLDRGQKLSNGDQVSAIAQQLDSTTVPPAA
eukprot:s4207_g3.t2